MVECERGTPEVCVCVGGCVRSGGGDSCDSYWLDLSTHLNE